MNDKTQVQTAIDEIVQEVGRYDHELLRLKLEVLVLLAEKGQIEKHLKSI